MVDQRSEATHAPVVGRHGMPVFYMVRSRTESRVVWTLADISLARSQLASGGGSVQVLLCRGIEALP